MILRKGAIAAHKGEKVLIPINMRDGSVIAIGKGNPDWNYSAPHCAGMLMPRSKAKESIDLGAYKASMSGIYSTAVTESTIDEAPMAYKSLDDIIDVITLLKKKRDETRISSPAFSRHLNMNPVSAQKAFRRQKKDTVCYTVRTNWLV